MVDMNTQIAALLTSPDKASTEDLIQQKAVSPLLTSLLQTRVSVAQSGNSVHIQVPSEPASPQTLSVQTQGQLSLKESATFSIGKTDSSVTLFDFLPIKQTTTLNQAEVQRLVRTLADAITLASIQSPTLSKGLYLHGVVEQASSQRLSISLQLPGSPTVTIPTPNNTPLFSSQEKIRVQIQAPEFQQNQKNWPVTISSIPPKHTLQSAVQITSPLVKLALVKGLGTEGIKIEGAPPKHVSDVLLPAQPRQPLIVSATMTLKNAQLSVQGVQSRPVLQFPVAPQPVDTLNIAKLTLPERFVSILNKVPQAKAISLQPLPAAAAPSNTAPSSVQAQSSNSSTSQVHAPTISNDAVKTPASMEHHSKSGPVSPESILAAPATTNTLRLDSELKSSSKISHSDIPVVQEKIRQLSRQLLAETGSTNEALGKLVQILRTHSTHAPATTSITQQWLNKIAVDPLTAVKPPSSATQNVASVESSAPATPDALANTIKQVVTAHSLVTTPTAILAPPSNSDFLGALVSILQLGLTGRALRNQSGLSAIIDKPESVIAKTIGTSAAGQSPSRVASDMAALDQRTQILKHVKTLLANHQQQKIQGAENRTQGTESFYYVLPITRDENKAPELLFRAEEKREHENSKSTQEGRVWHLTMKLDIGDLGELLAKSRIDGDKLKLDIYASTDPLLHKVYDTLPYLLRRLNQLGVEIEGHTCQRGQLKGLLKDAPYQLFEAMV